MMVLDEKNTTPAPRSGGAKQWVTTTGSNNEELPLKNIHLNLPGMPF